MVLRMRLESIIEELFVWQAAPSTRYGTEWTSTVPTVQSEGLQAVDFSQARFSASRKSSVRPRCALSSPVSWANVLNPDGNVRGGEFELLSQPLDKHGSFLNLPPPPAANPPAQPLTCLVLQKDERSVLPMLQPAHSHTVQPAENGRSEISPRELVPTTVGKVVCVRGALYVDG
eukprot:scaffold157811_cov31-Tisochrysis_lutea.AAC.1